MPQCRPCGGVNDKAAQKVEGGTKGFTRASRKLSPVQDMVMKSSEDRFLSLVSISLEVESEWHKSSKL